MKLAHYYKTLGLRRGAPLREVKAAYRELVRTCHPDLNPDQQSIDQFIAINNAYTALSNELKRKANKAKQEPTRQSTSGQSAPGPGERLNLRDLKLTLERLGIGNFHEPSDDDTTEIEDIGSATERAQEEATASTPEADPSISQPSQPSPEYSSSEQTAGFSAPPISAEDAGLKKEAYAQLKNLLRQQKFPRAIALVEGLAHRLPEDTEINQWQAIVYQRWGRYLIGQGQLHKAHVYLHKALQTDPHNPSLCEEVRLDLGQLDLLVQAASVT